MPRDRHASATKLQSKWRSRALRAEIQASLALYVAKPSMAQARAAQKAVLPHDELGNLLPLNCSIECFKCFGSGICAQRARMPTRPRQRRDTCVHLSLIHI